MVGEDDITAAHLRNLQEDGSVLRHLEPSETEARALADEELVRAGAPPGEETWVENQEVEEQPTTEETVGRTSIAVLQVAVTIGAMVAPYFFF